MTAGPGLVFPAEFAESKGESERYDDAAPATPKLEPAPSEPPRRLAPDPSRSARPTIRVRDRLRARGASCSERAQVTYPNPVVTARRMGRYAIELWIGQELIERVRFDFPLTAADEAPPSGPGTFARASPQSRKRRDSDSEGAGSRGRARSPSGLGGSRNQRSHRATLAARPEREQTRSRRCAERHRRRLVMLIRQE